MMTVVIALVVTLLGVAGVIGWWGDFMVVIKGSIPAFLVLGGAIAVVAGVSELKDKAAAKKEAPAEVKK